MQVGRRYALATKPVTVAQFERFLKAHPEVKHTSSTRKRYTPEPDCPIITVLNAGSPPISIIGCAAEITCSDGLRCSNNTRTLSVACYSVTVRSEISNKSNITPVWILFPIRPEGGAMMAPLDPNGVTFQSSGYRSL